MGVESLVVEFAKELFSVGGRGHHIQREDARPCTRNPAETQQETRTNHLDLTATKLKDLQRTDDSKEVRQVASVQPSTYISNCMFCVFIQNYTVVPCMPHLLM